MSKYAAQQSQVESGARDRYVCVQKRSTADAVGGSGMPVETWVTHAHVWMGREDLSGRERLMAMQLSASSDVRWGMNYLPSMDPETVDVPKMFRLVFRGRVFDITRAEEVGRREGIVLTTLAASRVDA